MLSTLTRNGLRLSLSVCLAAMFACSSVLAVPLQFLGAPETQGWSDLAFFDTTVSYDSGTGALSITNAADSSQLEIGDEFGPLFPGVHYGAGGNNGGSGGTSLLEASLSASATVDGTGTVTDGGSVVITYTNPPALPFPGDLADDYGIDIGAVMLEGEVAGVLLGATGAGTLDVLFEITGGFLQFGTNSEPSLSGIPFSTKSTPFALLRINDDPSSPIPADWTGSFTAISATNDVLGVPEPSAFVLALVGSAFGLLRRKNG